MQSVQFWASVPFLLPQAIRLKRSAPRYVPAAGSPSGQIVGVESVRLLAIGDSIVAGVGAPTLQQALVGQTAQCLSKHLELGVDWQCMGSIGATTSKVLQKTVSRLPPGRFDYIIVSVGVNDLTSLSSLRKWRMTLSTLLETLREHSPNALIAVCGMPPLHGFPMLPAALRKAFGLRAKQFDRQMQQVIARHSGVVHVKLNFEPSPSHFSEDGFHPSTSSYRIFGEQVANALIIPQSQPVPPAHATRHLLGYRPGCRR